MPASKKRSTPQPLVSVVIPVYRSAAILPTTLERLDAWFAKSRIRHELIFVVDGSPDDSWEVLCDLHKKRRKRGLKIINLLRNYGQHNAMICGLAHATGTYVVTMDDDLQNPPDQIGRLLEKIEEGHDVVFGNFRQKMHSPVRRLGTRVVHWLNHRIFNKPKDLVLTNFRIMRQEIARAVCEHRTAFPYLPGLLLVTARNFANVTVEHHPRFAGESNYTARVIARLIWRIIFNYSAFPLRVLTTIGLVTAAISFGIGLFYLIKGLLGTTQVPGWTTTVVLLSFYNGLLLAMLGAIGEYVVRLVTDISAPQAYRIREVR